MSRQILIAGGGIGGLATALACSRKGWESRLYERAPVFSEVGAGVQLGPNSTRILKDWNLGDARSGALAEFAYFPEGIESFDAKTGGKLATLKLGSHFEKKYGAPYATLHRSDLHSMLLNAVRRDPQVRINAHATVEGIEETSLDVTITTESGRVHEADALIGADGLWSRVRGELFKQGGPLPIGHLAYRSLIEASALPEPLRVDNVSVWMAPDLHVIAYPVRRGELINVVVVTEDTSGSSSDDSEDSLVAEKQTWTADAVLEDLRGALGNTCSKLREMIEAMPSWKVWTLCSRESVSSPNELAAGRVALVGDAGHPMLPYLAQGAGMAIEDAQELALCLSRVDGDVIDVPLALRRYALNRYQRVGRVQRHADRNGKVFHLGGAMESARNAALRLVGAPLMDSPWLYRYGA